MVILSHLFPALLVAAATTTTPVFAAKHDTNAKLTKPPLAKNLDYLKPGLTQALPETKYTKKKWDDRWIPQTCKKLAKDTKTKAEDFEVWDVKYADCGAPWVFCHHKSSGVSIDCMARQFGKVPIQMREWVRHIMDVPANGTSAFETDGNIVFKKPTEDMMSVILHETAHALDLEGAYGGKPVSSSDIFWDSYDKDPNVPDPYAATNMVENVAQNTVVAVFDENVEGGFAGVEKRSKDIGHQYATIAHLAEKFGKGNSLFKPGHKAKCTHRMPPSVSVTVDGKRRSLQSRRYAFNFGLGQGIIPIISKRQGWDRFSNCSISW